ncbi:hypothetical protein IL306_004772, partial [Fusarium sp. DS 682]
MSFAKHIEQANRPTGMGLNQPGSLSSPRALNSDIGNDRGSRSSVNGKSDDPESGFTSALPDDHAQYLLRRHGTIDLDPLPDPTDVDPLNWPRQK